jgi:uncharacterized protein YneF (UPF0154 family)
MALNIYIFTVATVLLVGLAVGVAILEKDVESEIWEMI